MGAIQIQTNQYNYSTPREGFNMGTSLNIVKAACAFVFLGTPLFVSAEIISQNLESSTGQSFNALEDTKTSLQWLSPAATARQTITSVLGGFGGWTSNGFRYALASELETLFTNSGISVNSTALTGPSGQSWSNPSDVGALVSLITAMGWTYTNNQPSPGYPFGQRSVFGILADLMPGDTHTPTSHYMAWFSANEINGYAYIPGTQWLYDSQDSLVGSFLVRDAGTIPEPTTAALVFIALLSMSARSRIKVRKLRSALRSS